MKKIIILFIIPFLLTGCVSYTELNELGIIDMLLIDYYDDNYEITINMLTPNKADLDKKTIYTTTDTTLDKCLNDLYLKSTKKISLTHLELLILTPNIAKEQYKEIINLFLNRIDSRNTFSTIITDKKEEIFEFKSKDINDLLDINHKELGIVNIKQFDNIIKDILELNISYIPRININENLLIEGYQSIYNDSKLLSKEESIGFNFITNDISQMSFTSKDIGYKINNNITNLKINKNKITINLNITYQIINNNTNINDQKQIENIFNNQVKSYINSYINNNNSNYFNHLIAKYNYQYYQNNKDKKPVFDININSNLIDNSNIKGGNTIE